MEDIAITRLDSKFDFDTVFKRNYCTLINIFTCNVELRYPYIIDGVAKVLAPEEKQLFAIFYREWMHETGFMIEENNFFTSPEKAKEYMENNHEKFGLSKITREEALELAKENLMLNARMSKPGKESIN